MPGPNPIRILIADDHPVVREGLAAIVTRREDMIVVGEAADGQQAVDMFRQYRPDVTLMDLRMPVKDGVEAILTIRHEVPSARIIILSTYNGDEDIYRGLQAGAKGYLLKDAPRDELLGAIRAVYNGKTRIPEDVAAKLAARVGNPDLTPREMDVLRLMAAGKNNVDIGHDLFITEGTVKSHINSILSKMNVTDRTQAVTSAIKRGLVHFD